MGRPSVCRSCCWSTCLRTVTAGVVASLAVATWFVSTTWAAAPSAPVVPRPDRRPADLDTLPPAKPEAPTLVIENHASRPFVYQFYRTTGPVLGRVWELPAQHQHRFTAPEPGKLLPWLSLRSSGAAGHIYIAYRSHRFHGVIVEKLLAGKRYAYLENASGYGELVERTGRPDDLRPAHAPVSITDPDEEAARVVALEANHNFRPDRDPRRVGPARLKIDDLRVPTATVQAPTPSDDAPPSPPKP